MFDAIVEVLAMPCKRLEEWFEEISTATSSRSDPARGSDEMVVDNLEVDLWLSEAEVMNVVRALSFFPGGRRADLCFRRAKSHDLDRGYDEKLSRQIR